MSKRIICIDLGTSNSVSYVNIGGTRTCIPNDLGSNTTPSAVAFKKNGDRLIGQTAKRQQVVNSANTFTSFKRIIGHTYEEVKDVKASYKIKANKKGLAVVECPVLEKDFTPEELSGFLLGYIKKYTEDYVGEEITDAIITCPAYFNQEQRVATQNAGKLAGLNVLRVINEPTAAALAYGKNITEDGLILVYDLGGGTFDVSVLSVGTDDFYQVIATSGDHLLGGDNIDEKIMDFLIAEFKKENGVDLSKDTNALQRLREAAEKAKCELSTLMTTNINLPYLTSVDNQPVHLNVDLTRSKFESLITDILERIKVPVNEVLKEVNKKEIKEILLVGGSTRIPCVVELIEKMIGIKASKGINPDLAVAEGACALAQTLQGEGQIVLADVTSLPFGINTNNGLYHILVDKNTTIPVTKSEIFTTAADNQESVDIELATGQRSLFKDNKMLGTFRLDGIPPARRGIPQIEVELSVDTSGILHLKAKDKATGKENSITITQSGVLTDEEIERMIKEAEEYAEQDKEAKELILSKNELESLVNNLKSTLQEAKDKVDESLITPVEEAITKAEDALKTGTKDAIEQAKNDLLTASHPLSAKLYENAQQVDAEPVEAEVVG